MAAPSLQDTLHQYLEQLGIPLSPQNVNVFPQRPLNRSIHAFTFQDLIESETHTRIGMRAPQSCHVHSEVMAYPLLGVKVSPVETVDEALL